MLSYHHYKANTIITNYIGLNHGSFKVWSWGNYLRIKQIIVRSLGTSDDKMQRKTSYQITD